MLVVGFLRHARVSSWSGVSTGPMLLLGYKRERGELGEHHSSIHSSPINKMMKLVILTVLLAVAVADPDAWGYGGRRYGGGYGGSRYYGGYGGSRWGYAGKRWKREAEAETDAVAEADTDADSYFYNAYYPSAYGYPAAYPAAFGYSAVNYGYGHPAYGRLWKREAETDAKANSDADSYFYNGYYPSAFGYRATYPAAYGYSAVNYGYGYPAYGRLWKREAEADSYGSYGSRRSYGSRYSRRSYSGNYGRYGNYW